MRPDQAVLERGPRESHAGVSRAWTFVQHRTAWEPPEVRPVRAVWTFGGGRCYSLASASVEPLLVHPLSSSRSVVRLEAARSPARRRLSTSWMLTLRAPSFHVGAGRAFTRCVPASDARCRLPAPVVGSCSDRQLLPRVLLSSARGSVHRETRIVPPSPRVEEPSASRKPRWPAREDGGTTQGACHRIGCSACLRRST